MLVQEDRKTKIRFHLFSVSMELKDYVLDVLTRYIMLQRLTGHETAEGESAEDLKASRESIVEQVMASS